MDEQPEVIGYAVLRAYPLRLWAQQREHNDALLREFALMLGGVRSGQAQDVPAQLLELAELVQARFGPLLTAIEEQRQEALDAGEDRMDLRVPLIEGIPDLLEGIRQTMAAVDEYCSSGELLTLARPREVVELERWTLSEIIAQYDGEAPTPWPGPW